MVNSSWSHRWLWTERTKRFVKDRGNQAAFLHQQMAGWGWRIPRGLLILSSASYTSTQTTGMYSVIILEKKIEWRNLENRFERKE